MCEICSYTGLARAPGGLLAGSERREMPCSQKSETDQERRQERRPGWRDVFGGLARRVLNAQCSML